MSNQKEEMKIEKMVTNEDSLEIEKDDGQISRLESLPQELLLKIFGKITAVKDMFRLLAVNRKIAKLSEEICFETIQKLDICEPETGLAVINGDEVKAEFIWIVSEGIWKRAGSITTRGRPQTQ